MRWGKVASVERAGPLRIQNEPWSQPQPVAASPRNNWNRQSSLSATQDPKDRGIAAYLEGQYQQAEELLNGVAEKKEHDLVETLRYLGAAQYQQAKYRAAADSFRKALSFAQRRPRSVKLAWCVALRFNPSLTEADRI